jgi:large subunit ribosomal protein L4
MINNNMVKSQNIITSYVPTDFFGLDLAVDLPSEVLVSQAMRVYFQNARQGTVATKSRSDLISRSNKKPWRQKGTGKARAGSARSPLWRGGGVCFGPQPRVRELSLPKKMLRGACRTLFYDILTSQKLCSIDYSFSVISTKDAVATLKNYSLYHKKIIFFYDINDIQTYSSFVNINNLNLVSFDSISPRALISDAHFVFLNKDINKLKEVVSLWLQ